MVYTNFFTREEILIIRELLVCRYRSLVEYCEGKKVLLNDINGVPVNAEGTQVSIKFFDMNSLFQFAQDLRGLGVYHKRSFMLDAEFLKA